MDVTQLHSKSNYRIFISFTGADKALAEYLAKSLRRHLDDFDAVYCYSLPGRRNSRAGSRTSDNFMKVIDDSLKKCNIFLLLWSTHAKGSEDVVAEYSQARLYYKNKVRRLGKEFKIVPISIDNCILPMGMPGVVYTRYSSGEDMQTVLNHILTALGLPEENHSVAEQFISEAIFGLRTAFRDNEWGTITLQYPNLVRMYPQAISPTGHYMYAMALIKQGKITESQEIVHEGLEYTQREEDAELLYIYVQQVKEKQLWAEVLYVAEKAMKLFPQDNRWLILRWEAI